MSRTKDMESKVLLCVGNVLDIPQCQIVPCFGLIIISIIWNVWHLAFKDTHGDASICEYICMDMWACKDVCACENACHVKYYVLKCNLCTKEATFIYIYI